MDTDQDFQFQRLNDLEYWLRTSKEIEHKCRTREDYPHWLYRAMCNVEWQRNHPWFVLKDEWWSCSWRYAGTIVSDLVGHGDYIDYYVFRFDPENPPFDMPETAVHPEIASDLFALGFVFRELEMDN